MAKRKQKKASPVKKTNQRQHTHNSGMRPIAACIRKMCLPAASLFLSLNPSVVIAGPEGGVVAAGQGNITAPNTTTTVINQQSQNLAIDWDSFNVNTSELVQFNQPSKTASALNRIHDQSASQIFGTINANGNVLLVNSNGIFFSPTASVNVNALVASGVDISTQDFMDGRLNFNGVDGKDGIVVNQGLLQAATGGSITLLGKGVSNEGVILASAGQVNLVAGDQITIDFDGDGLMQFAVNKEVLSNAQALGAAVSNTGEIQADGGSVLLKGSAAKDVFSKVVNNDGIIKAGRIENKGGVVRLVGLGSGSSVLNTGTVSAAAVDASSDGGTIEIAADNIENSGTLDVSAQAGTGGTVKVEAEDTVLLTGDAVVTSESAAGQGGSTQILGDKVGLFDNASVNVSGATGGGEALIGGDVMGQNADIRNASATYIAENAEVRADAEVNGDGGKIVVFSENSTKIAGKLSVTGGSEGGNGGFVETSGKIGFLIDGAPDISAPNGLAGHWLIDPNNITIDNFGASTNIPSTDPFTSTDDTAQLDIADLLTALTAGTGASVTVTTGTGGANSQEGDITLASALDFDDGGTLTTATLTLNAHRDININGAISDSTPGTDFLNLVLNADTDNADPNGTNAGTVNINANISLRGGTFTATGAAFDSDGFSISTAGDGLRSGAVSINVDGNITTGAITTSDITVDDVTSGAINLTSATGNIVINGAVATGISNVAATLGNDDAITGDITIITTGTVTGTGSLATGSATTAGGVSGTDSATSGAISVTAGAGDPAILIAGGITTGNAIVTTNSVDDATVGNITLSAAGSVGSSGGTAQAVTIGSITNATGSLVEGLLNATSTGTGTGGEIRVSSASTLRVGTLDTTDADTTNVNLTVTGGPTLLLTSATNLDQDTIVLTADEIDINATLTGTGDLTLKPNAVATTIGVAGGAGILDLSTADLGNLANGFSNIFIGTPTTGAHDITINAVTFNDPVSFLSPAGGTITVNGQITGSDNASITLDGSGATTVLNANIVTAGNVIDIQDDVVVGDTLTVLLDTTNGGAVTTGAAIDIEGNIDGDNTTGVAETLQLRAGTAGNITLNSDGGGKQTGGTTPLNVTIIESNSTTLSGALNVLALLHDTNAGNLVTNGQAITATSLTVNGSVFNSGAAAGTWDIGTGGVTIGASGSLTATSGNFTNAGNWTNNGTFTNNGGTVVFDGTGAQTLTSGGSTFNILTVNGTANTVTTQDNLTTVAGVNVTAGILDISAGADTLTIGGTLNVNGGTLTATNGSIDANGDVSVSLGGTLTSPDSGGTFTVFGNWTNSATVTNLLGTVVFDGTGTQTVTSGGSAFNSLTVNGTGNTVQLLDLLDVNSNLNITSGTLNANTQNINIAGNWVNADTFTASTGTVDFDGAGAQQNVTSGGSAFNNLTHSGSQLLQLQDTFSATGTVLNSGSGNFDTNAQLVTAGALTVSNGLFSSVAGGGAWDINAGGVTIGASGSLTATSAAFTVGGNWSNAGTFTNNTGTVTFDAAAGTSTINSGGTGAGNVFNNIVFNDGGGTATYQIITNTLDVDGNLTITGGTLDGNDQNITLAGNWVNNDIFTGSTGTVTFDAGAVTQSVTSNGASAFNNFTVGGTGNTVQLVDALDVNGNLIVSSGTLDVGAGNNSINVAGNVNFTGGDFTEGTGTFTLDGNAGQSVTSAAELFNIFTVNKTAGIATTSDNLATSAGLNVTGGTLDISGDTITVAGDLTVNGGTLTATTGTIDANANVVLSSGTLTAPSANPFTVAGNWTVSGGTFTNSGGTVTFDGAGAQLVTSGGTAFNNVNTTGKTAGSLTFSDAVTINGTLTTSANAFNLSILNGGTVATSSIAHTGTITIGDNAADTTSFTNGLNTTSTSGTTLFGTINTTNSNLNFSNTTLNGALVTLNTGAGAGNVTFTGTVNGTTDFTQDLTITAGTGNVLFNNFVGSTTDLRDVNIGSAGLLTINPAVNGAGITIGRNEAMTTDTFFARKLTANTTDDITIGGLLGTGGDVILLGEVGTNSLSLTTSAGGGSALQINSNILVSNGNIRLETTTNGADIRVDVDGLPDVGDFAVNGGLIAERTVLATTGNLTTFTVGGGGDTDLIDARDGGGGSTNVSPVNGKNTVLGAGGLTGVSAEGLDIGNNLLDSMFPQIVSAVINLSFTGDIELGTDAQLSQVDPGVNPTNTFTDAEFAGLYGTIGTTLNITTDGDIIIDLNNTDLPSQTTVIGATNLSLTSTAGYITDNSNGLALQLASGDILTLSAALGIGFNNTVAGVCGATCTNAGGNTGGSLTIDVDTLTVITAGNNNINVTNNGSLGNATYNINTAGTAALINNFVLTQDANDVLISNITADGQVSINSAAAIREDIDDVGVDISANSIQLVAGTGISDGNELDINASNATNGLSATTITGDINIFDTTGGLTIGSLTADFDDVGAVTTTTNGVSITGGAVGNDIRIRSNDSLGINNDVSNTGGGNVTLAAEGTSSTSNLTVAANIAAATAGANVQLFAGNDVIHSAGTISALGGGTVGIFAGRNFANGTPAAGFNGAGFSDITMSGAAAIMTDTGTVTLTATENVALTTVTSNGIVTITADDNTDGLADNVGAITDANADGTTNISATSSTLSAETGIDIDTAVSTLDINNATSGNVDINSALATDVTVNTLTTAGGGTIQFDQTGGGNVSFTTVSTTTDGSAAGGEDDITLTNTGGNLTVATSVNADGLGDINLSTFTTGNIILTGATTAGANAVYNSVNTINGAGLVSATMIDLDAQNGIGNTTPLALAGTMISADNSVSGNVDVANTAPGAVTLSSLTAAGTGTVQFLQTGNEALSVTTATTNDGTINIENTGDAAADTLTVTTATTGNNNAITLTTNTRGDITLDGSISAGTGMVTVDSADSATLNNITADNLTITVDSSTSGSLLDLGDGTLIITNTILLSGTGTDDVLRAQAGGNTWIVSAANTGTLNGAFASFSSIGTISGDNSVDTDTIDQSAAGAAAGAIDVVLTAAGTDDGVAGGITGLINFDNIDAIDNDDDANNSITGANAMAIWTIDGGPTEIYAIGAQDLDFSNTFTTLTGGMLADTFNLNADYTADLFGGAGDDLFDIADAVTLTGIVRGGAGNDTLDLADVTNSTVTINGVGTPDGSAGDVTATTDPIVSVMDDFDGINSLIGSGLTGLNGPNLDTVWNITGGNSGTYGNDGDETAFADFALIGGNQADTFFFNGGTIGSIDGGALGEGNTLIGDNSGLTFTINGDGSGTEATLTTTGFSNIDNIFGGTGDDIFSVNNGVTFSGILAGNLGNDTITANYASSTLWTIDGLGVRPEVYDSDDTAPNNTVIVAAINAGDAAVDGSSGTATGASGSLTFIEFETINAVDGAAAIVDTFNIRDIDNDLTINGRGGNDIFNVSNASNSLDDITAVLTLRGDLGADTLNIDDSGDADADTGTIDATTITGLFGAGGSIDYSDGANIVETIDIELSTGDDTFNVNEIVSTGGVSIDGNGGDDTFNVGNGLLSNLNGNLLTLTGGAGTNDSLNLDDSGEAGDNIYFINDDRINANIGAQTILIGSPTTIENLDITGDNSGADEVSVVANTTFGGDVVISNVDIIGNVGTATLGADTLTINNATAAIGVTGFNPIEVNINTSIDINNTGVNDVSIDNASTTATTIEADLGGNADFLYRQLGTGSVDIGAGGIDVGTGIAFLLARDGFTQTGDITAQGLIINTGFTGGIGTVDLTNAGNNITNLATNTANGSFSYRDADDFNVTTVFIPGAGGFAGITSNVGDVTLNNGGLLSIIDPINADGGFAQIGAGDVNAAANITTIGNDLTIATNLVVAEATNLTLSTGSGSGGKIGITGTTNGTTGGVPETLTLNSGTGIISDAAGTGPMGDIFGAGGVADATGLTTVTITNSGAANFDKIGITGNFTQTNAATGTTTFEDTVNVNNATLRGTVFDVQQTFTSILNTNLASVTTSATFQEVVNMGSLTTSAGGYAVSFLSGTNGTSNIGGSTTFNNTGLVTLGDEAGDTINFPGGLTHTAGATNLGGTINTTNTAVNLAAVNLDADTTIFTGPGDTAASPITLGNVDSDTFALTLDSGNLSDINITSFIDGGDFTITDSANTTVTGAFTAGDVTLTDTTTTIAFNTLATMTNLTVGANPFNLGFFAGLTVTGGGVTFNNTGGLALSNNSGNTDINGSIVATAPGTVSSNTFLGGTITSNNNDITFNGAATDVLILNTVINAGDDATVTLGTFNGGSRNLTVTADEMNFVDGANTINNIGTLTLNQFDANLVVGGADNADVANLNISTVDIDALGTINNIILGKAGVGATSLNGTVNVGTSNLAINGASATFTADSTFTATTTSILAAITDDSADNVTFNGNTILSGTVNTFGGLPHDGWDVGNLVFNGTSLTITANTILEPTGSITYPANVLGGSTTTLAITPPEGSSQTIGGANGVAGVIPTASFTNFAGHLMIGGTTNPLTAPITQATEVDINALTITVNSSLSTNGAITLLAGGLNLNASVSAGGPGGGSLAFVAAGTDPLVGSTGGTGDILVPALINVQGSDAIFVAANTFNDPGNVALDLNGGLVEVATGGGDPNTTITFGPGTDASTTGGGVASTAFSNFLGLFGTALNAAQIQVLNPAADLIGLEELGFIDTGLFEQDLTLFGQIGTGIALALAQCEEIEGCAPNVTEEELDEFIAQIEARLEELIRRAAEARTPSEKEKLEELIAGFQKELENFMKYREELREYLAVGEDEDFDEDLGDEDFGVTPDANAIKKLAKILESVNARIQWLESLKGNPEERARLSELTGIELTQEALDAIIEGAKSEAKFIERQLKLLQEGTEAMKSPESNDSLFIAATSDHSLTQVVNYGPGLLNLDTENMSKAWY